MNKAQKKILNHMARFSCANTHVTNITASSLATDLDFCLRYIYKSLKWLVDRGYIRLLRKAGTRNVYQINIDKSNSYIT